MKTHCELVAVSIIHKKLTQQRPAYRNIPHNMTDVRCQHLDNAEGLKKVNGWRIMPV
jgi:TPP-dependent 2-oxoacid decarboxylase